MPRTPHRPNLRRQRRPSEGSLSLIPPTLTVLGAPIGDEVHAREVLSERIGSIKSMLAKLSTLNDAQLEFTLLRACFSLPKFAFALRTSPPSHTSQASAFFDDSIRDALSDIIGAPINDRAWTQASLPVDLGGLGLRSAASLAPAAFLSSLSSASKIAKDVYPPFSNEPLLAASLALMPPSSNITALNIPPQKVLSREIDLLAQHELFSSAADDRERARLLSLTLPHNGDFLKVVPSKALGLALDPLVFRVVTLYRLGLQIYPADASCPVCGKLSDRFGDHAVGCGGDFDRIGRHDRLRDAIFGAARAAALAPRREVAVTSSQSRPADIFLPSWSRGRPAALDVTVTSSLQRSSISGSASRAGHALQLAERRKRRTHATACHEAGVTFIPLAVEALGGWSSEACETLVSLARFHSLRSADPPPDSFQRLLERLSVTLQRGNGHLIIRRMPPLSPHISGVL